MGPQPPPPQHPCPPLPPSYQASPSSLEPQVPALGAQPSRGARARASPASSCWGVAWAASGAGCTQLRGREGCERGPGQRRPRGWECRACGGQGSGSDGEGGTRGAPTHSPRSPPSLSGHCSPVWAAHSRPLALGGEVRGCPMEDSCQHPRPGPPWKPGVLLVAPQRRRVAATHQAGAARGSLLLDPARDSGGPHLQHNPQRRQTGGLPSPPATRGTSTPPMSPLKHQLIPRSPTQRDRAGPTTQKS